LKSPFPLKNTFVHQIAPEFERLLVEMMDVAGRYLPVFPGFLIGSAVILPELKSSVDVTQF
jgi:hypothetical protein